MKRILFSVMLIFMVLFFCSACPAETPCGIENCHGLDIVCGPNVPQVCSSMYALGDNCRRYVLCGVVEGKCRMVPNQKFDDCKACMEQCLKGFKEDLPASFKCESQCSQKIDQNDEDGNVLDSQDKNGAD